MSIEVKSAARLKAPQSGEVPPPLRPLTRRRQRPRAAMAMPPTPLNLDRNANAYEHVKPRHLNEADETTTLYPLLLISPPTTVHPGTHPSLQQQVESTMSFTLYYIFSSSFLFTDGNSNEWIWPGVSFPPTSLPMPPPGVSLKGTIY